MMSDVKYDEEFIECPYCGWLIIVTYSDMGGEFGFEGDWKCDNCGEGCNDDLFERSGQ